MMAWAASVRRLFGRPLAILAIAIQCLVIQTHVDVFALQRAAEIVVTDYGTAAVASPATPGAPRPGGHGPANCLVCQAAALGGSAVLSSAPETVAAQYVALVAQLLPRLPVVAASPSHTWLSRGPPNSLIA